MSTTTSRVLGLLIALVAASSNGQQVGHPSEVRIMTVPSGALISVDGVMHGVTPLTLAAMPAGEHLVIASKNGYRESRQTIALRPGQRAAVELTLERVFGLVLIHSRPEGAEVRIDEADRGATPLLLTDVTLGTHQMQVSSPGYVPKELQLQVQDRTPMKVEIVLTSDSATLALNSRPSGAAVGLSGISRGVTPCTLDRIPAGESTLELSLDGYETDRRTLRLAAGQEVKLDVVLKPLPAQLGIVSIPPGARIYVENQFRGEAPITLDGLQPGSYRIRAELPAHEVVARTVELRRAAKMVEEFRLQANCGKLELTTEPAGVKVFVDGKEAGVAASDAGKTDRLSEPLEVDLLSVGAHQVRLAKKGFFDKVFTVNIERDKTSICHQKLKRRFIPDCEVHTAGDVHRGVLLGVDPAGNVRLEIKPGIVKTIAAADILSRKPLRD